MRHRWLMHAVALGVLVCLAAGLSVAQNDATFQVNMKIKMKEGTFLPGSGDIVRVAGGFNNWGSSTDTLRDGDGDSIYTKTISLATGAILYKFLKTPRGGLDWEADPNREYTVVAGSQTIPVVYFDRDSIYNPPTADVPVTFGVDMGVLMCEGLFLPGSGDIVRVAGGFNNWGGSTDTLKDADNDSIYTKTITLMESQAIRYKFLKTPRGGIDWEGNVNPSDPDGNRTYTVPTGGGPIPVAYFNNDSVCSIVVTANVLWQAEMTPYQQLGWFNPVIDSLQVRGGFNSWGGSLMDFDPLTTGTYFVTVPVTGSVGEPVFHKYFIDLDEATAETRFPGYSGDADGVRYEHPYTRGDGNRGFAIPGGGNQATELFWFSDIHPGGLLKNLTDTVSVTMRVDMGPATRDAIAFDPAADSVRIIFFDRMWVGAQAARQGGTSSSFPNIDLLPTPDPADTIYQGTFKVVGKAHYGILYGYEFRQPGGATSSEGAGLGAQGGRRVRFIQPLAPNSFPRFYTAPLDSWKKNAPLFGETPPYNPSAGVIEDPTPGVPEGFTLGQNYPNPFNPSTKFRYSVPEKARVMLRVYDILGREVATLVNQEQAAGSYIALFESNNLPTGVYFYRLEAGRFSETRKMVLLR
ncbi:MAG: T9SS type A sorting domain-containing protein [Bacteroidota bacterium]